MNTYYEVICIHAPTGSCLSSRASSECELQVSALHLSILYITFLTQKHNFEKGFIYCFLHECCQVMYVLSDTGGLINPRKRSEDLQNALFRPKG